jgi:threonine/homoserine/homoserine lactone efflux protein
MTINFLIGPLFFTLLDTTIERGKKAGFAVITGIWVSDILLAVITYKGLNSIWDARVMENVLGGIGGVILILFGSVLLLRPYSRQPYEILKSRSLANYWLRGLVINTFNPFTVVLWISLATVRVFEPDNFSTRASFYAGMLGIICLFDVIKVLISARIKQLLTVNGISTIRKISGAAIALFGIILIIRILIN